MPVNLLSDETRNTVQADNTIVYDVDELIAMKNHLNWLQNLSRKDEKQPRHKMLLEIDIEDERVCSDSSMITPMALSEFIYQYSSSVTPNTLSTLSVHI